MTTRLRDIAKRIRSKNAGPFWVTIDIFCGAADAFQRIRQLSDTRVAEALQADPATLLRFELPDLHVLKFSLPRTIVQGDIRDRDMHGAQLAVLIAELEV